MRTSGDMGQNPSCETEKSPNPSNLPLLARRSTRHRRGAERQLEDGGTLETSVADEALFRAAQVQRVVEVGAVLHELAHKLVCIVLAKHDTAVQDEAIVHNVAGVGHHRTPHGRRNDLRYELAGAHVGVVRDEPRRAAQAVHGDGHCSCCALRGGYPYIL